ncbi:hypothetical protein Drorol1_Dr00007765 [Drosera rotundifolia]
MFSSSAILCSATHPPGLHLSHPQIPKTSHRHFNKHLLRIPSTTAPHPLLTSFSPLKSPRIPSLNHPRRTLLGKPLNYQYSYESGSVPQKSNPKGLSFEAVKNTLLELTPLGVCKWAAVAAIGVSAVKWVVNLVLNPFFWMYFSWSWMFWPWFVAVGVGGYGLFGLWRYMRGEAGVYDQVAVLVSAVFYMTLVPPAVLNGFLEGWPWAFFWSYLYFFFLNVSARKRLYGNFEVPAHDPKWDVNVPNWCRALFGVGVIASHWLVAYEAPELHMIPGGWSCVPIWIVIITSIFTQYSANFYLSKYSKKVVEPMSVVPFGAYRWVRHPIYASTMWLLLAYPVAMRAPLTFLFMLAMCLLYYTQKAKLEEALMLEEFKDDYRGYMDKFGQGFRRLLVSAISSM